MATDYDAPRKTDEELAEDSLEELKALGVEVQTIRSSAEADYKELILVEAVLAGGKSVSVAGTVIGKAQSPRIVSINGRTLEFIPEGKLLLIENQDQPGIIGALGTLLSKESVNINSNTFHQTRKKAIEDTCWRYVKAG